MLVVAHSELKVREMKDKKKKARGGNCEMQKMIEWNKGWIQYLKKKRGWKFCFYYMCTSGGWRTSRCFWQGTRVYTWNFERGKIVTRIKYNIEEEKYMLYIKQKFGLLFAIHSAHVDQSLFISALIHAWPLKKVRRGSRSWSTLTCCSWAFIKSGNAQFIYFFFHFTTIIRVPAMKFFYFSPVKRGRRWKRSMHFFYLPPLFRYQ